MQVIQNSAKLDYAVLNAGLSGRFGRVIFQLPSLEVFLDFFRFSPQPRKLPLQAFVLVIAKVAQFFRPVLPPPSSSAEGSVGFPLR